MKKSSKEKIKIKEHGRIFVIAIGLIAFLSVVALVYPFDSGRACVFVRPTRLLGIESLRINSTGAASILIKNTDEQAGWLGSRVVSVLDSDAERPRFKSQPRRCRITVLDKLFTSHPSCLCSPSSKIGCSHLKGCEVNWGPDRK